jgi:hypothetical protein
MEVLVFWLLLTELWNLQPKYSRHSESALNTCVALIEYEVFKDSEAGVGYSVANGDRKISACD